MTAKDFPPAGASRADVEQWERRQALRPMVLPRPLVCVEGASERAQQVTCGNCGARGHKWGDRVCPFSFKPMFDGRTHVLGGCPAAPTDANDPKIVRGSPSCFRCDSHLARAAKS